MTGSDLAATQSSDDASPSGGSSGSANAHIHQHDSFQRPQHRQAESAPFQSQFEHFLHSQQHPPPAFAQYGQQPFDMAAMAGALPHVRSFPSSDPSQGIPSPSSSYQQSPQTMYLPHQRPQFADPAMMARAQQQQHFMGGAQYGGLGPLQRQHGFHVQSQIPYSPVDPYGFGMSPMSPMAPGFGPQQGFLMPAGLAADLAHFARQGAAAEAAPVPNFPRGPPRKPKQSGHALWVGNLPPAAVVTDLKDHFSKEATNEIESVFLIAKSNCAFVNYKSEAACVAAMNRFHDSRFHGVRLVCRLRRGTASTAAAASPVESSDIPPVTQCAAPGLEMGSDRMSPTIARSQSRQSGESVEAVGPALAPTLPPGEKVPEKYFIVKSLTAQDLEASVRNGIWATQSHNENALNCAYDQAHTVYLIFSANKSGEYFGYARMASAISGEPVNLSTVPATEEAAPDPAGSPQSIPTPATATAPKGRIIDDSARGTIFWEADLGKEEEEESPANDGSLPSSTGQNWGKQFSIEWLSTNRLPFYRTRGLRNPWNANREVKIARDGTELEPSVGRRLVQMFHRPSPSPSGDPAGMLYR